MNKTIEVKWKIGDKVKLNINEFNKYYGNWDWLEDLNIKIGQSKEDLFTSCLNEMIACSGVGEVVGYGYDLDPRVIFCTEFLGLNFMHQHYFCKNALIKV